MSLSQGRTIFGIHSVTPYSRVDGTFWGTLKVLQGSSLSLSGEIIELRGGSNKYAWAAEEGPMTAEMSLKANEYSDFIFELFLGKAPTANAAEATGNVSTPANKKGTSVIQAATGIATITAKTASETDLKFGRYVVKALSATTVDVFISSDIDIARGTNGSIVNNAMKITTVPLTIAATVAQTLANYGLEITGGSGAIALVTGDTATFAVRPPNSESTTVVLGSDTDALYPEIGMVIMAQKKGSQEMLELDVYRCKSVGVPIGFDTMKFSEYEAKIKVLHDSAKGGVFEMRHVVPV